MGAWGTQPLENDGGLDLKSEWDDSTDVSILEDALDTILSADEDESVDVIDSEAAVAAVYIILNELNQLDPDQYKVLLQKSAGVLGRVVENSELRDVWAETESFGNWLQSITVLMQQIVEKLQD